MQPEMVFKALADRTRQRTLTALCRHELSVSELVEVLQQPQSTVSRHLKTLREAGLIRDRRDGSTVLYSVVAPLDGDGAADELSARLLSWASEQPLSDGLDLRLRDVVRKRRETSHRFFDRIGRRWDALREESFGGTFHLEAFLGLLPSDWVVADIGTGTGYLLPILAGHFRHVIGVEPVEKMLEAARGLADHRGLRNVQLSPGELADLPIPSATVDLAVTMLVLHHVPTPRYAVAEFHRILADGGHVLIVEQTAHGSETFHERMQDHWWGFESNEITGWLESAGFTDIRSVGLVTVVKGADAPDLVAITARKPRRVEPDDT